MTDRSGTPGRIDRRTFLQRVAAAAPMFRTSAAARRAAAPDAVVVIGAGLAGLHAAAILRDAGRDVTVLEARGDPGGRVRTIRGRFDEDLYAEAGPIRISAAHARVLRLVREHGLPLVPFESPVGAPVTTVGGVTARLPEQIDKLTSRLALQADEKGLAPAALLDRFAGDVPRELADPSPSRETYARWAPYDRLAWPAWLRSRGASAGAVRLMTVGGDSSRLSALYVLRQIALLRSTDQYFKIQGGMDTLPAAMARTLEGRVRYDSPVLGLERSASEVRVRFVSRGSPQTMTAGRALISIPFSTLRAVDLRPAFSAAKMRAIRELPYFPAVRFLLQSRTRFWEEAGLRGSARTDRPAEIWDCTYDLPATAGILGATIGGTFGGAVSRMPDPEALEAGRRIVEGTFAGMRADFQRGVVVPWMRDRWARGAFAVCRPGQMTALLPDAGTPEGRVHFAGEHTSSSMGWMEGALESGERAAREILAS